MTRRPARSQRPSPDFSKAFHAPPVQSLPLVIHLQPGDEIEIEGFSIQAHAGRKYSKFKVADRPALPPA